jgi:hypothetical protein
MHLLCGFYRIFFDFLSSKVNHDVSSFPPPPLLLGSSFLSPTHRHQNNLHKSVIRHSLRRMEQAFHSLPCSPRRTRRKWCRQFHNPRWLSRPKLERVPATLQSLVYSLAVLHHCGSACSSTELGPMRHGRLQCLVLGRGTETLGWI